MKKGELTQKLQTVLTREQCDAIIGGRIDGLWCRGDALLAELYTHMREGLRPKTIVEYKRKAFIAKENRIRITFDHEINATESCFDLFGENLIMNPVMDRQRVILEVKYNHFLLEYIKRVLNQASKSELSVSKYVLARQTGYLTRL